jgi:hypothetical protein
MRRDKEASNWHALTLEDLEQERSWKLDGGLTEAVADGPAGVA